MDTHIQWPINTLRDTVKGVYRDTNAHILIHVDTTTHNEKYTWSHMHTDTCIKTGAHTPIPP